MSKVNPKLLLDMKLSLVKIQKLLHEIVIGNDELLKIIEANDEDIELCVKRYILLEETIRQIPEQFDRNVSCELTKILSSRR